MKLLDYFKTCKFLKEHQVTTMNDDCRNQWILIMSLKKSWWNCNIIHIRSPPHCVMGDPNFQSLMYLLTKPSIWHEDSTNHPP